MALRFRALGMRVLGYDPDRIVLRYALDAEMLDGGVEDLARLCEQVDALVIAAPVKGVLSTLVELLGPLAQQAQRLRWIIDIASVKAPIAYAGRSLANFVGTHPMAGTERQGPTAADAKLFEGRPWVLSPSVSEKVSTEVRAVIAAMGARPIELDPVEHDTIVAATSHLPQTLSTLLAAMLEPKAYAGLYGTGLRSMIRLAASPWSMWQSIYETNTLAILNELQQFQTCLGEVIGALEAQQFTRLEEYFAHANAHVKDFP